MEKPDANGFVNINWPSKTIPHGGIFHSRTVQPSAEQQEFLRVLLEESKLSIAQRKKSALALREYDDKPQRAPPQMPLVRPRTSKRRSLSAIRESGAFEFEPVCPLKRGEDREKLKQRLANLMAYGDTPEQTPPAPPRLPKPKPKIPTNKETWHDLVTQIRERAEWLAEMEYLGEAGPHREIIKEQIAERMRALDALGIDSECSTARSTESGFSTLRSRENLQKSSAVKSVRSTHSNGSQDKSKPASVRSSRSQEKPQPALRSGRKKTKEENVAAYDKLSPLQYSPRRRQ
ncbi:UPF0193 protein EVG1 homolog [Ostrinia nubilalis]|uniref:UPF0193 protein EVG1 homolog n=1 Tax=Ostrinia nubilalis TaxID=29057 RepID=UPI0030822455